jgi:hypothetical protein
MAKLKIQSNPRVNQIFDDLEKFRDFCVAYGYRFDESFLYNMRNYAYQQYSKFTSGKNYKNQWEADQRRFS